MLTQSQFALLSGSQSLDCLSAGDFATVRDAIEQRLMLALCLTAVPVVVVDDEDVDDILWLQLLADTLAVSVNVKQDDGIQSENMRNYSYTLRDYANSWAMLSIKSSDLLAKFNACDNAITFQTDLASHIYGHDYPCGGCGHCHECI